MSIDEQATTLIGPLSDTARQGRFCARLLGWLLEDLNSGAADAPDLTPSRAHALLKTTELLDDPTYHSFQRLAETAANAQLALVDLLADSGLAENEEVAALAATSAAGDGAAEAAPLPWLPLALAAYAWQRGYPVYQLDPASPPAPDSPAGQLARRAAQFFRRQVQRSATEREKALREIAAMVARTADRPQSLDTLAADQRQEAVLPYYRPPVPVRYPEVARDTLEVEPGDEADRPPVTRGEPLVISEEELDPAPPAVEPPLRIEDVPPQRMPEISISRDQVDPPPPPSPLPRSGVILPQPSREANVSRGGMLGALRQMLGPQQEMTSTRLQVTVRQHPDGEGLQGLQVRVTCRGIRSHVAGTTDVDGEFMAELPVPVDRGLTYAVEVHWPRDLGGDVEIKEITLNAERTRFTLPFFHQYGETK